MIVPTPVQTKVLSDIQTWLASPRNRRDPTDQVRVLTGAAGTGKTSIASAAVDGYRSKFCAPTGKAALVLREKGCAGARTIHSLIYRPREGYSDGGRVMRFSVNPQCELGHGDVDVVVADESSMVDDKVMRDLLSFGIRVLFIGDPYQLPPVEEGSRKTSAFEIAGRRPDWHLDEVHRQARESGVLRLATDVREGRGISRVTGAYGEDVVVAPAASIDPLEVVTSYEQVLVGTRRARRDLNAWVRQAAGVPNKQPIAGDKVVCRRNNGDLGLINGGQWMVTRTRSEGFWSHARGIGLELESLGGDPDGPSNVSVTAHPHHFEGREEALKAMTWHESKKHQEFDYAYAMTCHAAQGSQWDTVAVVDESGTFGADAMRWMYTAATRAAKKLIVLV